MKKRKKHTDHTRALKEAFKINSTHKSIWPSEYHYEQLLEKAKHASSSKEPTAHDFCDWIINLTHPKLRPFVSKGALHFLRLDSEREIEEFRIWFNQSFKAQLERNHWVPEYVHDTDKARPPYLASHLTIDGKPLRCSPHAVLRHKLTSDRIIIEQKITNVPNAHIPIRGWPNLLCQLWCYAWIDDWAEAANVFLIGEIWTTESVRKTFEGRERQLTHATACPRLTRDNQELNEKCRKLFEAYGGAFID